MAWRTGGDVRTVGRPSLLQRVSPRCRLCGRLLIVAVILVIVGILLWMRGLPQRHQGLMVQSEEQQQSRRPFLNEPCSTTEVLCGVNEPRADDNSKDMESLKRTFYSMMSATPGLCQRTQHFGEPGDGGYDICIQPASFKPATKNCLVYSFGLGNDWTFDEAMLQNGCEVHSFDPSIGIPDPNKRPKVNFHPTGLWGTDLVNAKNWTLQRLSTIRKQLNHDKRIIDVLKIDAEGAEWPFVRDMFTGDNGTQLMSVRQILFELHCPIFNPNVITANNLAEIIYYIQRLQATGFKAFRNVQRNGCCGRFAAFMPKGVYERCCHETFYVNTRLASLPHRT